MPGDLQAFLENREISKWIRGGGGYSYRAHFTSRAARDIDSYFEKGINQRSLFANFALYNSADLNKQALKLLLPEIRTGGYFYLTVQFVVELQLQFSFNQPFYFNFI